MDFLLVAEPRKVESVRIETPMGSIESDSGNHLIDILSVVGIIGVLYIGKVLVSKYFKTEKVKANKRNR